MNDPAFLHLPEERWPKGNAKLEISKLSDDDPQAQDSLYLDWCGERYEERFLISIEVLISKKAYQSYCLSETVYL